MNLPAGAPVTSQSIRVWLESSNGKTNILLSIPARSTISELLSLCRVLDFSSMCYLIRWGRPVLIASVCFAVRNGIVVGTDNAVWPLRRSDYFRCLVTQPTLATCLAWGNESPAYGSFTLWIVLFKN
jgi:hypothetical protein